MVSAVSPESVAWAREALEHLYDLSYLSRCARLPEAAGRFTDARALQAALSSAIQQMKPSPEVPPSSLAWRIYNALSYRYVRGLSQAEAAAELNISLRQLRREQDRGIEAVATLLFDHPARFGADLAADANAPTPVVNKATTADEHEFTRLDDLLCPVLRLLDPLFNQRNLHARLVLPDPMAVVWVNRMALRQLLIMAITELIRGAADTTLHLAGEPGDGHIRLTARIHKQPAQSPPGEPQDDAGALRELADTSRAQLTAYTNEAGEVCIQLLIPASAKTRVLMVDDSEDSIELARRYLEKTQYELVGVTRPEEVLSQAQTLQPASIILDVMMPRHDGWEILSLLKAYPETRRIPVIVSSVLKNQDLAYALGAEAVLPKPHTAEQLMTTLAMVIG